MRKNAPSLPTLHQIIEQRKSAVAPEEVIIPVTASTEPAPERQDRQHLTTQSATVNSKNGSSRTPIYPVLNLDSNGVLRWAYQAALLNYFKTKLHEK